MAPPQSTSTPAKSPAPKFKASLAIVKVNQSLVSINGVIVDMKTPVSALVVDLSALTNQFINPGLNFCDDIIRLCATLKKALDLMGFLMLFPDFGAIIGNVKKIIESLNIDRSIKEVALQIKAAFARDTTMKPITDASNKILKTLQTLSDKLQPCRQTLATMTNMFSLVDLSIFVLYGTSQKDKSVDDNLTSLEQMVGNLGQQISKFSDSLKPIRDFAKGDTLKNFTKAIAGPLSKELAPLQQRVRELQDKMGPFVDTLTRATDKLGPVKWVLGKFDWIVKRTIGPIIDFIVDRTPLKSLLNDIQNKVQSAIGVGELKKKVSQALETALGDLRDPLSALKDKAEASLKLLETFSKELDGARNLPADKLLAIVTTGLKAKFPGVLEPASDQTAAPSGEPLTARVASEPVLPTVSFDQQIVEHIDDWEDLNLDIVKEQQRLMTKFVDVIEDEIGLIDAFDAPMHGVKLDHHGPNSGTVNDPPLQLGELPEAPKLTYADFDGEAVSVLMRVDHDRVHDEQENGLKIALVPMGITVSRQTISTASGAPPVATNPPAVKEVFSSGGKAPKLEQFTIKCDELSTMITKAKANIERVKNAASQADSLFSSFAPEAGKFSEQLVKMLAQLDSIFAASTNALELPLKYRTVLTVNLSALLTKANAPPTVGQQISDMYTTIKSVDEAIKTARSQLTRVVDKSKSASASYQAFFTQANRAVAPSRFPASLGLNVTSLSALIVARQVRLDQAASSFTSLATMGQDFVKNPDVLVDPAATFSKVDALYDRLQPLLKATTSQAQQISLLVDILYATLSSTFTDMQSLFDATQGIVKTCRAAEAQVISADVFRGLCTRLNLAVAPFESFLAGLPPPTDTPTPNKTSRMVATTVPELSTKTVELVEASSLTQLFSQTATQPKPSTATPAVPPVQPKPTTTPQNSQTIAAAAKTANKALGGAPFDIVTSLIGPKLFDAMKTKLNTFVNLGELELQLNTLTALKATVVKENIDKLNGAIANIIKAVDNKGTATLSTATASLNPLLDQAGAQSLAGIVKEIETLMAGAIKPAPTA